MNLWNIFHEKCLQASICKKKFIHQYRMLLIKKVTLTGKSEPHICKYIERDSSSLQHEIEKKNLLYMIKLIARGLLLMHTDKYGETI